MRKLNDRKYKIPYKAKESSSEAEEHRLCNALCQANKRAKESSSEAEERRASNRLSLAKNRASESARESEQRKACNRLRLADKRANESPSESEQRRAKNHCLIANTRAQPKSIEKLIQEFLAKVKLGPDYMCTCCHRMLYRHSVIGFNPTKYTKTSPELLGELCEHIYVTSEGKQWVCKTCDGALSRGNLPVQAKANGM